MEIPSRMNESMSLVSNGSLFCHGTKTTKWSWALTSPWAPSQPLIPKLRKFQEHIIGIPHQKNVWRQQQLANNHPANNHPALVAPQGAEAQHEPALEDDEEGATNGAEDGANAWTLRRHNQDQRIKEGAADLRAAMGQKRGRDEVDVGSVAKLATTRLHIWNNNTGTLEPPPLSCLNRRSVA